MFNDQAMTDLEEAQRLLVAQADIQRNMLRLERAALGQRLGWICAVRDRLQQGRPLLVLAGALVAGFVAFRSRRGLARWLPMLLEVPRLASLVRAKWF